MNGARVSCGRWPRARRSALGAFALTEPQAGSDARGIKTTAKRDGDDYVLNGAKQFIISGAHAHVVITFACPGAKDAISAFSVPGDTAGIRGGAGRAQARPAGLGYLRAELRRDVERVYRDVRVCQI